MRGITLNQKDGKRAAQKYAVKEGGRGERKNGPAPTKFAIENTYVINVENKRQKKNYKMSYIRSSTIIYFY